MMQQNAKSQASQMHPVTCAHTQTRETADKPTTMTFPTLPILIKSLRCYPQKMQDKRRPMHPPKTPAEL